ncbi:MAG: class I SAM-dependent methyltransferase [Verrucomicrobia bacterium]|nr:class I SAM-dependent methyltransferase [Verrucomicrobiota bacterium]
MEPNPTPPPDNCTHLFRSSWSLYDAILAGNYMSHREIHACVREVLMAQANHGRFALLDLGCGNARLLADTLRTLAPRRYLGVDLSPSALAEAAHYLHGLPHVELREQDLLACAQDEAAASTEVVYSGFAVHHLNTADKQRLFHAVARLLRPEGSFLLVDVVRDEGQTREAYLERYLHLMRSTWTGIEPTRLEEACQHVAAFDYPEMLSALTQMSVSAGLGEPHVLGQFGAHTVMHFRQSPAIA